MDNTWTDIVFVVNAKDIKPAEAICVQFSSSGIFVEDYSDMEKMLPLVGGADYIDTDLAKKDKTKASIHVYVSNEDDSFKTAEVISSRLTKAGIEFEQSSFKMPESDWSSDWKQFHKPQRIGERFVICPTWETFDSSEQDIVITIDPASAFGSGKDETTRLCLKLIETTVLPQDKVLDIGCGSGILSIACLLLGAKSAIGLDIEDIAVEESVKNAKLNGVGKLFSARCGNIINDRHLSDDVGIEYDLICANIIADVHLAMKEIYFDKLKPNGRLVISGIITGRENEVLTAFESRGFRLIASEEENGWNAFYFIKTM